MGNLLREAKELSLDVNRTNKDGIQEYLIISDFGTSFVTSEPGLIKHYVLRLFEL